MKRRHRHKWRAHSVTEVIGGNVVSEAWQTCECGAEKIDGKIIYPTVRLSELVDIKIHLSAVQFKYVSFNPKMILK